MSSSEAIRSEAPQDDGLQADLSPSPAISGSVAETSGLDNAPLAAPQSAGAPATPAAGPTVVLCNATPGASWPRALIDATETMARQLLAAAEVGRGEGEAFLWLGYTDPLESLTRQLNDQPEADPLERLEQWVTQAEGFLKLKRDHPEQCRLVNLTALTDAMAAELLAEQGLPPPLEPLPTLPEVPPLDPRLLVVVHQQQAAASLYADLEACADLLGRQPNFNLPLPHLRSVAFAAQCLQSWQMDQQQQRQLQEQRHQRRISEQEHHLALAALEQQHDQALERISFLSDERNQALERVTALEQELERLKVASETDLASLQTSIDDSRAAAELTEMQLQHVHDALERLLAEREESQQELESEIARCRSDREQLNQERQRLHGQLTSLQSEHQALHAEMLHYMMASQASSQLERQRIPRLTSMLRQALQLG